MENTSVTIGAMATKSIALCAIAEIRGTHRLADPTGRRHRAPSRVDATPSTRPRPAACGTAADAMAARTTR
ncbi:hypothetical protein [Nocardia sp. CC227C]|uniref:hypothetical protein n=1 Tax=Nocardia sp. CC227C TaxID=3044562 RepID=UPI00278C25EE|nr:hypothetical protein [Nocardia sp. CC227C]